MGVQAVSWRWATGRGCSGARTAVSAIFSDSSTAQRGPTVSHSLRQPLHTRCGRSNPQALMRTREPVQAPHCSWAVSAPRESQRAKNERRARAGTRLHLSAASAVVAAVNHGELGLARRALGRRIVGSPSGGCVADHSAISAATKPREGDAQRGNTRPALGGQRSGWSTGAHHRGWVPAGCRRARRGSRRAPDARRSFRAEEAQTDVRRRVLPAVPSGRVSHRKVLHTLPRQGRNGTHTHIIASGSRPQRVAMRTSASTHTSSVSFLSKHSRSDE
jgi:hypothetical protein